MEKNVVYSMRMSSAVRGALKRAAKRERRSVASLLDKIIADYLEQEGFLKGPEFDEERRKSPRKKIALPASIFFAAGTEVESCPSVVHDISLGGVMVSYPKGSEMSFTSTGKLPDFELCFELPRTESQLRFECEARHMRDAGNQIEVGAAFRDPNEKDLKSLKAYIM